MGPTTRVARPPASGRRAVARRRWLDGLFAVAVTTLMLVTPSGSFLSPRGRNRSLNALVTLGAALEIRYLLQKTFEEDDGLRQNDL